MKIKVKLAFCISAAALLSTALGFLCCRSLLLGGAMQLPATIVMSAILLVCESFIIHTCIKFIYKYTLKAADDLADILKHRSVNTPAFDAYLDRSDAVGYISRYLSTTKQQNDVLVREQYQNKLNILYFQMKSLESQVNAHFLNNTLEAINSIAEIEGIERISIMALALGRMYRYSIKTAGNLVTLRDELAHLKYYIDISEIRFQNKFKVYYDISPSLYECKMLKLILQPVVENAVCHGLNPCRTRDGRIDIKASKTEHDIFIEVSDNGVGIDADKLAKLCESIATPICFDERNIAEARRIGLKNVHSRIGLYYGSSYGLSIKSAQDEGTTVTIKLPYQRGK